MSPKSPIRLKNHSQSELHLALDGARRQGSNLARPDLSSGRDAIDAGVWVAQVHFVKDVVHIPAELESETLSDLNTLAQRNITLDVGWASQCVSSGVAQRAGGGTPPRTDSRAGSVPDSSRQRYTIRCREVRIAVARNVYRADEIWLAGPGVAIDLTLPRQS